MELNAEIAGADAVVRTKLRWLGMLHRREQHKAEVAGQLVADIKRLLRLRGQREEHVQSKPSTH